MRPTGLFSTAVLSFSVILGTSSLVHAQERREEAKPPQGEMRPEEPKPAQDEMQPRQEEVKPQEQNAEKPGRGENKPAKQDEGKANKKAERNGTAQRSAHIPDDKFRAHFGRQHTFVVNHPTMVEGQPRFRYSGYWFTIVDVWPVEWAYTDQVYVDFIDGEYFLFDVLHPGVQVALIVVE